MHHCVLMHHCGPNAEFGESPTPCVKEGRCGVGQPHLKVDYVLRRSAAEQHDIAADESARRDRFIGRFQD
jgi:hypothetical protein